MAVGCYQVSRYKQGELSGETEDPNYQVDDVWTLTPVEQRNEDVEVEERCPNNVDLCEPSV